MVVKEIAKRAEREMRKAIEATAKEFNSVRTGRASTALLEGITVEAYGNSMPLNQVANVSVPEHRLLTIQPWDASLLPAIEKAILKSDLGITPSNDGRIVRIAVPPLTEERRRELVKVVKKLAEEGRVAVRNLRRDGNEELKKLEREKTISEDDVKRGQKEVQDVTDRAIKEIDELLVKKEKEILEF